MAMTGRSTAVCAIDSRAQAERAIDELKRAGFGDDEIGFAMRDVDRGETETHGGGGATAGAVTGGVVGGV